MTAKVNRPAWRAFTRWWTGSLLAMSLSGCATSFTATNSELPAPDQQFLLASQATSPRKPADRQSLARTERAAQAVRAAPPSRSSVDVALAASAARAQRQQSATTANPSSQRNINPVTLSGAEDGFTQRELDVAAPPGTRSTLSERLKIPTELPGADAPPLALPPFDPTQPEERGLAIDDLFPGLRMLATEFRTEGAADQAQLTLEDLQRIALESNPTIAQATGDVEAAMGAAIQAGVYPNPMIGYEADTVGSGGTRNYQGIYIQQEIPTAGKLEVARAAANVELMNKQLSVRRARADLLQKVRANYFAVLVARENLRYSEALVRFTNEVYRIQVEQLKGGQAAAYEPMQLRALAVQARGVFAQARNRYASAWKQLAAVAGQPDLPASPLDGRVDLAYEPVDYDAALTYMLTNNTEMLTARNLEFQGRLHLRLAEITPIPNVHVYSAVQKDFTTPPITRTTYNLQVGIPVPIFDRNRGGIQKARGELVRAAEELNRVRLDLTGRLADAFERYENNRMLLEYYRNQILPDQARVYRGVYERHQQESEQVGFGDVIVAQQNLLASIASYITAMNAQWTALADLTGLLQLEDIRELPLADDTAGAPAGLPPLELEPLP